MRLIERESQLAALHQYAGEASRGQGRLVLISGEAGVGKSVLLEEFAERLGEARWLWAGCDGLFTPAALGPLVDIANQINGELLQPCRAEAKRDQLRKPGYSGTADALRPGVQLHRRTQQYGLPPFYSLDAWVWKDNPAGNFEMWNPSVHCDET